MVLVARQESDSASWQIVFNFCKLHHIQTSHPINPFRMKTPKYFFPRGNEPLLYHQIGNRNFFIFITNQSNLRFWVDKIKYEHLAILSNLKSCQFAPKIVIFNLCICCQFEDLQIILPKIIPMSHRNIQLWQMRAHFMQNIFLFLLVPNSEFLENLIKIYCTRPHFDVV